MQRTANDYPNDGNWKCSTCVFFDERAPDYGFCRRHAPQRFGEDRKSMGIVYYDWPVTRPESRCGEWVSFERK